MYFYTAALLFIGLPIIIALTLILSIKLIPDPKPSPRAESKSDPNVPCKYNILSDKYEVCSLLTTTEYNFYTTLKELCDKENFLICPKVRLEDFIYVTAQERMKYRGYIKSRHVDFVICNSWLKVIGAIELDDASHNTQQAQEVDNFKNNLFEAIGIPLFRIKTNDFHVIRITEALEYLKELIAKENEENTTSQE